MPLNPQLDWILENTSPSYLPKHYQFCDECGVDILWTDINYRAVDGDEALYLCMHCAGKLGVKW